jgi:ATP-dependent Clp protease ATP-binding subunit ClpC
MYEKFTDRARRILQLADEEAQRFKHEYFGTEHILLGLVKEGNGVAARVLKDLHIDLLATRLEVEKLIKKGVGFAASGRSPQTSRAKKVIEYALEESRDLHHDYVGSEHILLGLLRVQEGVAAVALTNLGATVEGTRSQILALLGPGISIPSDSRSTDRIRSEDERTRLENETVSRCKSERPGGCPSCGEPPQRIQSWSLAKILRRLFGR